MIGRIATAIFVLAFVAWIMTEMRDVPTRYGGALPPGYLEHQYDDYQTDWKDAP